MYIIGYGRIRVGSVLPLTYLLLTSYLPLIFSLLTHYFPFTYPLLSLPLTYPLFYSSAEGTFHVAKVLLYAHVRK